MFVLLCLRNVGEFSHQQDFEERMNEEERLQKTRLMFSCKADWNFFKDSKCLFRTCSMFKLSSYQMGTRVKSIFRGMKISHKQLSWVFLFLMYFYYSFISMSKKKSCTKAVVSPNQFLVTLGLLSKHSKWSVCLFSKLTCCFLPLRSLLMCATCSWLSLVAPHVCPLCSCLH